MNEQARLFNTSRQFVPVETPAARATDPETSHEAAGRITASGERGRQQRDVLSLIRANPGWTAGELAEISGDPRIGYYEIQRRVSELEPRYVRRGQKRRCRERGTTATPLWPVEAS